MTTSCQLDTASPVCAPRDEAPLTAGAIRVLQVLPQLATGGTELGVVKVMAGLKGGEFEHRICAIRRFEAAGLTGLDSEPIVLRRPGARLQISVLHLAAVIKAYRPHIVHSRNWGAIEAVPAARLAGVPVAIHSEHGYELDMLRGLPLRRRLLRRAVYAMADAVFAVTRELRDYHARQARIAPERIGVIYNGVNTERFMPRPERRAAWRRQLGLPEGAFVAGSVGRMVAIKDYPTLLSAAERVVREGFDIRVLLVGGGPELHTLQQRAAASSELRGRIVFTGISSDIPDLLNAMDAFVLPSIREGMSNTLLEAMASGLPLMATRVGGNPEVIEDGVQGWLFPPGDVDTLSARLAQLAQDADLRRRTGAAGRQKAVGSFSIQRMLSEYRDLYLDLARRKRVLPMREGVTCAE